MEEELQHKAAQNATDTRRVDAQSPDLGLLGRTSQVSNTEGDAGGQEDLPGSLGVLVEGVGCAWLMLEPKERLWGHSETERVLGARGGAGKSRAFLKGSWCGDEGSCNLWSPRWTRGCA